MKDENYINIQGWMINHLNLKPLQLILFALIYGFSQDDETEFKGSLKYMEKALNVTRPTLTKALKELTDLGLVEKRVEWISGVSFNRYRYSLEGVKKLYMTGKESFHATGKESLHYNNSNNNTTNNSKSLFPDLDDVEKEFQMSVVYDKKKFMNKLSDQSEIGIDVGYYYHAIDDWSQGLPKKDKRKYKTVKGWIAQARTFMRMDKEKGKLVTLKTEEEQLNKQKDFMAYMNIGND